MVAVTGSVDLVLFTETCYQRRQRDLMLPYVVLGERKRVEVRIALARTAEDAHCRPPNRQTAAPAESRWPLDFIRGVALKQDSVAEQGREVSGGEPGEFLVREHGRLELVETSEHEGERGPGQRSTFQSAR